jgi:beta-1,4-mannosyltransferase
MPTVPVCWFVNLVRGKRFVIDWHNFGFSLLKVHRVPRLFVKIAEYFEFKFGRLADGNITVTDALRGLLAGRGINSAVVPDRPSSIFHPCRDQRDRFAKQLDLAPTDFWLVSSTSWTPDEDMRCLLDAADSLNADLEKAGVGLSIVITGKGPGRCAFEHEARARKLSRISFSFQYFDRYEEYAQFLGCCDAGVSLHVSSSGVDLPMKGLDMIGAGLPLLSVTYQCITELVDHGRNGVLFRDGQELAGVLRGLIITKEIGIEQLREGATSSGAKRWDETWEEAARPVLFA